MRTHCAVITLLCACIPASAQLLINGAGATFPYPIYAKWFDEYRKVNPKAHINYQSIGSGGGIRQLQAGTVDFGASDSPMTDAQIASAGGKVLHFPTVLGAVVPTYNIPGVNRELNFTAEALAGIFLGAITRWNDAELARANPGVSLPAATIVVIHRSDASGTTFIWTDYLSKANAAWKQRVGAGPAVKWLTGLGAKGNEGIAGLVRQTPNAIGYVELVYAIQNRMSYGRVRNAAGVFVKAGLASVTAAGGSVALPDDFRVSITDPPGKDAYPIASFTWLLVPARIEDAHKRGVITGFLRWMLADGQRMAEPLGYSPLPKALVSRELKAVGRIQ